MLENSLLIGELEALLNEAHIEASGFGDLRFCTRLGHGVGEHPEQGVECLRRKGTRTPADPVSAPGTRVNPPGPARKISV
jgi:hypothetical protein